jgi:6-phosphogluconate dehydrogenase
MELGLVGLGRMGGNMATRLLAAGHRVIGHDRAPDGVAALVAAGGGAASLRALVAALVPPRTVWLMLPAGAPTDAVLRELAPLLTAGDTVVDGANTFYKDDVRRAGELLRPAGLHYVDVGVSGGVWGLEQGYCLMVGGEAGAVDRLRPLSAATWQAPAP